MDAFAHRMVKRQYNEYEKFNFGIELELLFFLVTDNPIKHLIQEKEQYKGTCMNMSHNMSHIMSHITV